MMVLREAGTRAAAILPDQEEARFGFLGSRVSIEVGLRAARHQLI